MPGVRGRAGIGSKVWAEILRHAELQSHEHGATQSRVRMGETGRGGV